MARKSFRFERLAPGQYSAYRAVRLEALKESPEAFTTSYRDASARSDESWRLQGEALALASDRAAFLAHDGSAYVGLMAFYGTGEQRGEVMQVWISPRTRGTGAAQHLLERVLHWARAQGYRHIDVRAKASNSRALRFYEKAGFLRAETDGDEVRLELPLA